MAGKASYGWLDGEFVPWDEVKVHVRTECVMRGANVFEGIKGYWDDSTQELWVFKMAEHLDRLFRSMKVLRMVIPYSKQDLCDASIELLRRNEFREDVHFRPTVYFGDGEGFGYKPDKIHIGAFITGLPQPPGKSLKGITCSVSSWERISDRVMPPRLKSAANYMNGRLASVQAKVDGYDSTILLNEHGKVAECPGACVFVVRDGVAFTPAVTNNILESITRSTIIELFQKELGTKVVEREIDRTELYVADEVFCCGTAAEVTPILSVDRITVGSGVVGELTGKIQSLYFDIGRGRVPEYSSWLTRVWG